MYSNRTERSSALLHSVSCRQLAQAQATGILMPKSLAVVALTMAARSLAGTPPNWASSASRLQGNVASKESLWCRVLQAICFLAPRLARL